MVVVVVVVDGQDLWSMINGFWILYPWPQRLTGSGGTSLRNVTIFTHF